MTKQIITYEKEKTIYIADDGTEFDDKFNCVRYEYSLQLQSVWAVVTRGQQVEGTGYYSTKHLAELASNGLDKYTIVEIKINKYAPMRIGRRPESH